MSSITTMLTSARLVTTLASGADFFTGQNDAEAEEKSDDNNLQHRRFRHRLNDIRRENIHQSIHEIDRIRRFIFQSAGLQNTERTFKDIGEYETDNYGTGRRRHVEDDSLPADRPHLPDISHRDNAGDNRRQHDGHDDKFDQVQENRTERFDIIYRPFRLTSGHKKQPRDNTESESDKNLGRKRQFSAFFHKTPPITNINSADKTAAALSLCMRNRKTPHRFLSCKIH